jgi:hypothetical protein
VLTGPSYGHRVEEIGSRRRNLPAPPRVVFDDLCDPHRQPVRPWLHLLDDEAEPVPDQALTGHLRKRMNELINANLRYTYGQ